MTIQEKGQTTQWPYKKKDKQRSTKRHTKNKRSRNTNPTKTGGELRCTGRISSSYFNSGTVRVTLSTSGTYPCSFVTRHRYSVMVNKVMAATAKWQCHIAARGMGKDDEFWPQSIYYCSYLRDNWALYGRVNLWAVYGILNCDRLHVRSPIKRPLLTLRCR